MPLGEVDIHFSPSPTTLLPYHLVQQLELPCAVLFSFCSTSHLWLFAEHSNRSFKHVTKHLHLRNSHIYLAAGYPHSGPLILRLKTYRVKDSTFRHNEWSRITPIQATSSWLGCHERTLVAICMLTLVLFTTWRLALSSQTQSTKICWLFSLGIHWSVAIHSHHWLFVNHIFWCKKSYQVL